MAAGELADGQPDTPFDADRVPCRQGGEDRWSARWLMQQMGYLTWQDFEPVIERAKTAAHNEGFNVRILFRDATQKTGGRPQTDYLLTRFAAYLVAMNGQPAKPEVAAAQTYFAVKTRQAEACVHTFSLAEVAAEHLPGELKDPVRWLSMRLNSGQLRGVRFGRYWRMRESDIAYMLERFSNSVSTQVPDPAPVPTDDLLSPRARRLRSAL
ncbi:hypothetical protein ACK280_26360 [Mycobacterium sherrisii]|uniref:hypothetical protein n=1 Tax=Mycobacterium sherrisii TaxID=243061 RepID=UPI0039760FB4